MDCQNSKFLDDDDDDRSISSESSGGGNQVTQNNHYHNIREDLDIWNACEIGLTLGTLPNAEDAQEMLDQTDLSEIDGLLMHGVVHEALNFLSLFLGMNLNVTY